MLPVSLDCSFLFDPSVFSNVHCQFYDSLVIYHVIRNVEDIKSLDNTLANR